MITKYGLDTALTLIILSVIVIVVALLVSNLFLKSILIILGVFVLAFTLNFFRDPERTTPKLPNAIFSPADGKVVQIGPVQEQEFLGADAMQVCVFMSPLNVHVNRWPIDGIVKFYRYVAGEYLVAFDDKSSERNERTLIGVDNGRFKVLFKQIAGFVARRIVCPIHVGDTATAGARFGMIKFGSRVDVIFPKDAEIKVRLNDHVVAGETILALVPDKAHSGAPQ